MSVELGRSWYKAAKPLRKHAHHRAHREHPLLSGKSSGALIASRIERRRIVGPLSNCLLDRKIIGQSKQHFAAAGEGYGEHFRFAATVRLLAIAAGLACLIPAAIPALCTRTCSTIIARHQSLFAGRRMLKQVAEQSSRAVTVVGLVLLSGMAATSAILVGAAIGALANAIPLAFLLSDLRLDTVASRL